MSNPRMMSNKADSINNKNVHSATLGKDPLDRDAPEWNTNKENDINTSIAGPSVHDARPGPENIINTVSPFTSSGNSDNNSISNNNIRKSVRFVDEPTVYQMEVPLASIMTKNEKQSAWYSPSEYDQFKYDSAHQAGVKVIRYDSAKAGQGHHFLMLGDFDACRKGAVKKSSTDVSKDAVKRCYYNENEYDDRPDRNGKLTCKRGLGYHFSRSRKKSRAAARSAVLAWQETLRRNHAQSLDDVSNSATTMVADNKTSSSAGDKSRMMLALVSTKCSRTAREEARWRGDVDYRIAYPDRAANIEKRRREAASTDGMPPHGKMKRRNGMVRDDGVSDDSSKRQRTADSVGTGCGTGRDRDGSLSPATIGFYLNGVLQAEV